MSKDFHDLSNLIDRLRIMKDLIKSNNYSHISKDQIEKDLPKTLKEIEEKFRLILS